MSTGPYILLASGARAYIEEPGPVAIEDIAHALSRICRFTGHTREFYSVAEHSCLVSAALPQPLRLTGLLHDASEAILGDVNSPLKSILWAYRNLQERWEKALAKQFGTVYPLPDIVKKVDLMALATEKRDLMPASDEEWPILTDVPLFPIRIQDPRNPDSAYQNFMKRFRELYETE